MPLNNEASDLEKQWPQIVATFARAQTSSLYCSIASVDTVGQPNVTPIGTLFLGKPCSGFYFDQYTASLAANVDVNPEVCAMAVNASKFFWLRALLAGKFSSLPGVRLYGTAGPLRDATPGEKLQVQRRIGRTRWLKGGRLLWSSFTHVRDLSFTSYRLVAYPVMMERFVEEAHNHSIERTCQRPLRALWPAAHVKR